MGLTLARSSFSTSNKQAHGATAAIFDPLGQLVAKSSMGGLLHTAALDNSVKPVLEDYALNALRPGDVYITNDPYRGGTHSNDVSAFSPVFSGGRPRFIVAANVHVADLGGVSAGGVPPAATEIYHEGLLLPPIPLQRAGQVDSALLRLIALNSRTPAKALGDIRALMAATQVGVLRLGELLTKYGPAKAKGLVENVLDYTETLTRLAIEQLPEGEFSGQYQIDDDGIDLETGHWVRLTIHRSGSDLVVDLTGTDPQARGPINSPYSQSLAGIQAGLRYFIDPTIPMNAGCLRPIRAVLPLGTLVNPRPPAAVNARIVTASAILEAMLQIQSQQRPERTMAASGTVHVYSVSGNDPDRFGNHWLFIDAGWGGTGAVWGADGLDCTANLLGTRAGIPQMEPYEAEYPVRFESHRRLTDSGGMGTWRGGLGLERTIRVLTPAVVSVRTDRVRLPPVGALAGRAGRPGAWIVNEGSPSERVLQPKQMSVQLQANDTLTMRTSGGGGVGPPAERSPERVADDLVRGKISPAAAGDECGYQVNSEKTAS